MCMNGELRSEQNIDGFWSQFEGFEHIVQRQDTKNNKIIILNSLYYQL